MEERIARTFFKSRSEPLGAIGTQAIERRSKYEEDRYLSIGLKCHFKRLREKYLPHEEPPFVAKVALVQQRDACLFLPLVPRRLAEATRSAQEQAKGLMFRTSLGDDEGMIFLRNPPDRASFWMRNTVIPLDIVYVGLDRRIMNIAANAVPYDETPLYSAGPTLAVFEINGGLAARLGIKPGDKVEW